MSSLKPRITKPRITAQIAGRALHPLLRPFAVGYFLTACAADLVYTQASVFVRHSVPEFADITEWLLIAGLVMAVLAAVVALIDLLGERQFRTLPDLRMYAAGGALVMALELYNLHIRLAAGADAITSTGVILSVAASIVLLATPSQNWARMYRHAN
jgi:uncharacterized membrane protein